MAFYGARLLRRNTPLNDDGRSNKMKKLKAEILASLPLDDLEYIYLKQQPC